MVHENKEKVKPEGCTCASRSPECNKCDCTKCGWYSPNAARYDRSLRYNGMKKNKQGLWQLGVAAKNLFKEREIKQAVADWRRCEDVLPTEKDGDARGNVLAWSVGQGIIILTWYSIDVRFVKFWARLPKEPKGKEECEK